MVLEQRQLSRSAFGQGNTIQHPAAPLHRPPFTVRTVLMRAFGEHRRSMPPVNAPCHAVCRHQRIRTGRETRDLETEAVELQGLQLPHDPLRLFRVLPAADAAQPDHRQPLQIHAAAGILLPVAQVVVGRPALEHRHPRQFRRSLAQLQIADCGPPLVTLHREPGLRDDPWLAHPVHHRRPLEAPDLIPIAPHLGNELCWRDRPRAGLVQLGEPAAIQRPITDRPR